MTTPSDNPKPRGRPTLFNAEVAGKIVASARDGNYRSIAARAAGVSPGTLCAWLKKGKSETAGPYADFLKSLIEAEALAEIDTLEIIQKAAKADPANARWFLERRYPDRWGRNTADVRDLERTLAELKKQIAELRPNGPTGKE